MKKILIVISMVLVALVIFGAGFVFAQSQLVLAAGLAPGFGHGGMTLAPNASAGVETSYPGLDTPKTIGYSTLDRE